MIINKLTVGALATFFVAMPTGGDELEMRGSTMFVPPGITVQAPPQVGDLTGGTGWFAGQRLGTPPAPFSIHGTLAIAPGTTLRIEPPVGDLTGGTGWFAGKQLSIQK